MASAKPVKKAAKKVAKKTATKAAAKPAAKKAAAKTTSPSVPKTGSATLPESIFGIEPNVSVMHQVVTAQLAHRRS